MKLSGIYMIKNVKNGKIYVGSSIDIKTRLRAHKNLLKRNKHCNNYLQNSFNKYGLINFKFEILEVVEDKNLLNKREQFYIDKLETIYDIKGYNIRKEAKSNYGLKHSQETKIKIGKSAKKRFSKKENHNRYNVPVTRETRDKLSKSLTGKSNYWYGKGHLLKGSKNRNSKLSEEDVIKIKIRIRNGELLKDISKSFNVSEANISNIKRGKRWAHIII
jgi:group I intron endonuclease